MAYAIKIMLESVGSAAVSGGFNLRARIASPAG